MSISPVATFAIFAVIATKHHSTLDSVKLFTSLSLLILLSEPLFSLFVGVIDLVSAVGCFDRIERFLSTNSRKDTRVVDANSNLIRSAEMENSVQLQSPVSIDIAFSIENGAFGWSKDNEPILRQVNMRVTKGEHVAIIGPVGCGKSTLLKSILGETPLHKGEVHLAKPDIAWCEQETWLINASLQRNIVGFSNFNASLYHEVIYCCDLVQDLATLSNGDQTKVGNNGMSLSGGQKQRVVSVNPFLVKYKLLNRY